MYTDKILACADCNEQFVFTASEQDFYAQRGFSDPKRCGNCRAARKASRPEGGGGGYGAGGYDRGPREMFAATCSKLRQRDRSAVPSDERKARLLQRLLPERPRQLTRLSTRRRRPGRSARVVSFCRPRPSATSPQPRAIARRRSAECRGNPLRLPLRGRSLTMPARPDRPTHDPPPTTSMTRLPEPWPQAQHPTSI